MKRFIIIAGLLGIYSPLLAQQLPPVSETRRDREDKKNQKRQRINEILKHEEEGEPSYNKHSVWGFKVNHDGYGLSYELGRMKTPYKATILQFELNEKKHLKEKKESMLIDYGPFVEAGRNFVYGKVNHFYQLKGAYGQQVMIGNKGNKNGVAVYGIYSGGLSLGLLRPAYLEVVGPTGRVNVIRYTPKDSAAFLDGNKILGGTGLAKGWSEMTISPGIHAKAALRFDWNRFNNALSAVEFGFNFEYYPKKIEQMVRVEGRNLFANGYLSLVFGKRK